MMLFILFLLLINNVYSKSDFIECNNILKKHLMVLNTPDLGAQWNYDDINKNIHNIHCGVFYTNNKILFIDNKFDENITP